MLRSMRMKNFKSWADTGDIRLAPITGFYGANSSGKTSLLQMLLLIKQTDTLNDPQTDLFLGDSSSLVNLGTFYSIVHKHDVGSEIEFSLAWHEEYIYHYADDDEQTNENLFHDDTLKFKCTFQETEGRILANQFEYITGNDNVVISRGVDEGGIYSQVSTEGKFHHVLLSLNTQVPRTFWGTSGVINIGDDTLRHLRLERFLDEQLNQLKYLGPLRATPERVYVWGGDKPSDVGKTGERMISALMSTRAKGETNLEQKVAEWLKKMGLIHSFKLQPIAEGRRDYEIVVKKTAESAEVLITDIGFGVSQLLPVLVLCYYVPEGSTLILEQPEIHLHPSVQADLADVFIDVIKNRNLQIIFESHSEYLLHRLQRRMAEEGLAKDQTALYFCRAEGESSQLEELALDEYGNISNWPKDFFGDSTGDLVEMTKAEMRRKLAEK